MSWIIKIRAIGGLLTISVLLALLVADFWFTGRDLSAGTTMMLLSLIGALLGVDILRERLPIDITIGRRETDEE